jgi:hypothetical protein
VFFTVCACVCMCVFVCVPFLFTSSYLISFLLSFHSPSLHLFLHCTVLHRTLQQTPLPPRVSVLSPLCLLHVNFTLDTVELALLSDKYVSHRTCFVIICIKVSTPYLHYLISVPQKQKIALFQVTLVYLNRSTANFLCIYHDLIVIHSIKIIYFLLFYNINEL